MKVEQPKSWLWDALPSLHILGLHKHKVRQNRFLTDPDPQTIYFRAATFDFYSCSTCINKAY